MITGQGATTGTLTAQDVERLLASALEPLPLDGKRVLALIPDGTRTAPIPLLFRLLYEQIGQRVRQLDYLIALGTHPPMTEEAISRLVGVSAEERAKLYPNVRIFNHHWNQPEWLQNIGTISPQEARRLTGGLLTEEVSVVLNRLIFEYDQLIICGPVFPHEVVGFSGGAKYLFPGIAGEFVPRPVLCLALVLKGSDLHGLYIGSYTEAFDAAADLSAQLNIIMKPRAYQRVLAMPAEIYDDLWTAAKAMYKTEPVVTDGGEVIIYAPHISEISYTHGRLIDQVGYHVRDYFLKQWERFKDVPGTIKAHSTHVKGVGTFDLDSGVETARIQVTLATSIPEERCRRVNLGYADYRDIDPQQWAGREAEGILFVPHAGETLYRASDLAGAQGSVF